MICLSQKQVWLMKNQIECCWQGNKRQRRFGTFELRWCRCKSHLRVHRNCHWTKCLLHLLYQNQRGFHSEKKAFQSQLQPNFSSLWFPVRWSCKSCEQRWPILTNWRSDCYQSKFHKVDPLKLLYQTNRWDLRWMRSKQRSLFRWRWLPLGSHQQKMGCWSCLRHGNLKRQCFQSMSIIIRALCMPDI